MTSEDRAAAVRAARERFDAALAALHGAVREAVSVPVRDGGLSVSAAARAARVNRATIYEWRRKS